VIDDKSGDGDTDEVRWLWKYVESGRDRSRRGWRGSNLILHRHLAPPRTDLKAIRKCSRFFTLQFFLKFYFSLLFFISYLFRDGARTEFKKLMTKSMVRLHR